MGELLVQGTVKEFHQGSAAEARVGGGGELQVKVEVAGVPGDDNLVQMAVGWWRGDWIKVASQQPLLGGHHEAASSGMAVRRVLHRKTSEQ